MKLKSEHLFELAKPEINSIWRMQYFFWNCLKRTVDELHNFNIVTVNAILKKQDSLSAVSLCDWISEQ